jgi:hypothetical protein
MGLGTPDCPLFPDMFDYVRLAAGGRSPAAKLILAGEAHIAFNPAGGFHHAHPARASGFCYVNDVVLACETMAAAGRRVLFLDIDAHHGDGVQDAFYDRSDVMTISMHESGRTLFPGTGFEGEIGHGDGRGYNVNLPLPVGTYDAAFLRVFERGALPRDPRLRPRRHRARDGHGRAGRRSPGPPAAEQQRLRRRRPAGARPRQAHPGHRRRRLPRREHGAGWALCWSVLCGDQSDHDAMSFGMGGVMLETTEWTGGLRDRMLITDAGRRSDVDVDVDGMLRRVQSRVFPLHGIDVPA